MSPLTEEAVRAALGAVIDPDGAARDGAARDDGARGRVETAAGRPGPRGDEAGRAAAEGMPAGRLRRAREAARSLKNHVRRAVFGGSANEEDR